jgi:hypothetical protein
MSDASDLRPGWVGALVLAAALVAGCSTNDGGPTVVCLPMGGTWDVSVDLDSQQPGTNLCPVTWEVAQAACDVSVAAALPCEACFLGSPDCWGAGGQASGSPEGSLYLQWSWSDPYPCSYRADLEVRSDGVTLSGTILLEELWAPGGTCTGFVRTYSVTGTRRPP